MPVPPTLADPDGSIAATEDRPSGPSDAADAPRSAAQKTTLPPFVERLKQELEPAWHRLVARFGLTKVIVGGVVLLLVVAAFLLPGGEHADPFEGPGGAIDLLVKLGAVLALAYVSMAVLRRYTAGSVSQRGSLLEVLDSTTLGPNRAVYVVRAGDRRLVLGVTQNQITPLGDLTEETGVRSQESGEVQA